jgi:hypothetical protein
LNRFVTAKGGKAAALPFTALCFVLAAALSSCDLFSYGQLGGADKTVTLSPGGSEFEAVMSGMSGVWYSHYAGMGRLDGYRIGRWEDFDRLITDSGKAALFPNMVKPEKTYTDQSGGNVPAPGDYFVFYDDTVFGQSDEGAGGNGGWEGLVTRYIGIVRAVNVFNGDTDRGAIVIEYLQGCAPLWLDQWPEAANGTRPFFGIYYKVLSPDIVQMANAVDLAALYAGEKYYTETDTLDGALALNSVENEAEFISWGVVIPQDREK